MKNRTDDSEEVISDLKKRKPSIGITVLVITTTISILAWGWQFFIQPMIKTPTARIDIVEADVLKKLDKSDFTKQCDLTQAALDKKADKETLTTAIREIKIVIKESNADIKSDLREVKKDIKGDIQEVKEALDKHTGK